MSVEIWAAIIGVFVALAVLYFSGQSGSAADRPADDGEKQTDIQERPIDAPQPQESYR